MFNSIVLKLPFEACAKTRVRPISVLSGAVIRKSSAAWSGMNVSILLLCEPSTFKLPISKVWGTNTLTSSIKTISANKPVSPGSVTDS